MRFKLLETTQKDKLSLKSTRGLAELRYCLCSLLRHFCADAGDKFNDSNKFQLHHKNFLHGDHDFNNLVLCPTFLKTDKLNYQFMSPNSSIHRIVKDLNSIENIKKYVDMIGKYKVIDVARSIYQGSIVYLTAANLENDLQNKIHELLTIPEVQENERSA